MAVDKNLRLGATASSANDLGNMGALTPILGQLAGGSQRGQMAADFARQMYPDTPKADPYEAALQFFLAMGQGASQPGATVLSSAVGAMQAPADYLAAKKKEKRDTDRARIQTAVQLAPSLKPKEKTAAQLNYKSVMITKPDGEEYEDFIPTSEIAVLQKQGFKVLAKPTSSTATFKRTVYKPDGSKREVYSQAEFDSATGLVTDENPSGGWSTSQPASTSNQSSSLTDYKPASPEGLAKFKAAYPDAILSPEQEAGTVAISLPNSISNDPNLLGAFVKFKEPRAGSQYERIFDSVNDIGTRLAAFNADNTLPPVSQKEINEYAANYQKLIVGGEFTELVDGQEVKRRRPGIDLSETTNLPIPAGLDLDAILEQRSQKFDENQTKSATFGSKMLYTEGIVLNVMAQGYVPSVEDLAKIKLMDSIGLGTIGLSTEARQYHNAAQAWVAAQLRDESGAAIGPTEYANALRDYFPQVGDDSDTINNKRALREATVTGMINSSGDAFDVMYPGARQYLKYNDGETTYDILNSQGYANELLTKARLGRTINFKSTISVMDTDELIQMAQNPNRETLYTPEMLEILAEEIAGRN